MAGAPGEPYKQPRYGGFQEPRFLGGSYGARPFAPAYPQSNKPKTALHCEELCQRPRHLR